MSRKDEEAGARQRMINSMNGVGESYSGVASEIVVTPGTPKENSAERRFRDSQAQIARDSQYVEPKAPAQGPLDEVGYFSGIRDYVSGDKATEKYGLEGIPEFGSTDRGDAGNWWNDLNRTSVFDPKVKREMLKDQYGDNIRFEDVNEDITKVYLRDPKTDKVSVSLLDAPGFSMEDLKGIGTQAAYYGGTAAGGIGIGAKVGLKGMGLLSKMLAAGAASGLQETGLQTINQTAGRGGYDPVTIGASTLIGGLLPGAVNVGGKVVNSRANATNKLLDSEFSNAPTMFKQNQKIADESGIDLNYAQKSGGSGDRATLNTVRDSPEYQYRVDDAFRRQDEQINSKAMGAMDQVSKNKDTLQTAGASGRDAAQGVIDKASEVRSKATEKLYARAESFGKDIDTSSGFSLGNGMIAKDGAKANTSVALKPYVDRIDEAGGNYTQIKSIIDDMGDDIGELGIKPKVKRALTMVQKDLIEKLEKQNPHYKQAQKVWARESVAVDKLKNGFMGKAAGVNTDLKGATVGDTLFGGANATVEQVKLVKSQMNEIDPNAFKDLLREHMEQGWGKMAKDMDTPKAVQKAFFGPNKTSRDLVLAGLDPEARKNFMWFYKALDLANKGRAQGSDTAGKEAAKIRLGYGKGLGQRVASVKDFFLANFETPSGSDPVKLKKMFDLMTSTDSVVIKDWVKIRQMSGGMEAQLAEAVKMLGRSGLQK